MVLTPLSFKRKDAYKDPSGKSEYETLAEYFNAASKVKDAKALMGLITFFYEVQHEGQLMGNPVGTIIPRYLSIWGYSQGGFCLYYAYNKLAREICLLYIHRPGTDLISPVQEAVRRGKLVYKDFIKRHTYPRHEMGDDR